MSTERVRLNIVVVGLEKTLQDLAYMTYAHNIAYTASLDAMFAGMPGYLGRSHAGR